MTTNFIAHDDTPPAARELALPPGGPGHSAAPGAPARVIHKLPEPHLTSSARATRGHLSWIAPGQRQRVNGHSILGGVYVDRGSPPSFSFALAADPFLAAEPPGRAPAHIDYRFLHPTERRQYLEWLATRQGPPGDVAAAMLFAGLEWRLFVDRDLSCDVADELENLLSTKTVSVAAAKLLGMWGFAQGPEIYLAVHEGLGAAGYESAICADLVRMELASHAALGTRLTTAHMLKAARALNLCADLPLQCSRWARAFTRRWELLYPAGVALVARGESVIHYPPMAPEIRGVMLVLPNYARELDKAIREVASTLLEEEGSDEKLLALKQESVEVRDLFQRKPRESTGQGPTRAKLHGAHRDLVACLRERTEISPAEFQSLARELGLMPYAALDAINRWSIARTGELLLIGNDPIQILHQTTAD